MHPIRLRYRSVEVRLYRCFAGDRGRARAAKFQDASEQWGVTCRAASRHRSCRRPSLPITVCLRFDPVRRACTAYRAYSSGRGFKLSIPSASSHRLRTYSGNRYLLLPKGLRVNRGSSLSVVIPSVCHRHSPSPRKPILRPSSSTLEITNISGMPSTNARHGSGSARGRIRQSGG